MGVLIGSVARKIVVVEGGEVGVDEGDFCEVVAGIGEEGEGC